MGSQITFTIARSGDLLSSIFLEIDWTGTPPIAAWRLGYQIIDYAEIEIGGQVIDKQYGEWMDIWCQLTHSYTQQEKLSRLLNGKLLNSNGGSKTYTPLQFWFCRNIGLALPLIALQYHEVKINLQLHSTYVYANPLNNQEYIKSNTSSAVISTIRIFCDYVFLDTDERRGFAQNSHEYLIEQVQYSNNLIVDIGTSQLKMNFNHPVKELIWALKRDTTTQVVHPFDFWAVTPAPPAVPTSSDIDMVKTALIQFNNQDRFQVRDGTYFRCVQPYLYHTGANRQVGYLNANPLPPDDYLVEPFGGFYIYSFGVKPEEHQPSGTCNFSRIDNAILLLTTNSQAKTVKIYAINYNILRIMSGMGGLAYSN